MALGISLDSHPLSSKNGIVQMILSLSTTCPPLNWSQDKIAGKITEMFRLNPEQSDQVHQIYQNSAISTRHSILEDYGKQRGDWEFWGNDYPYSIPGTSQRNALYKQEAPALASRASQGALQNWGGKPSEITHVISISCTGVMAPGIEFLLIKQLGLQPTVRRLGINMMGCFGAFKGLEIANAIAKENPHHRILVVCTELCSLHLQADQSHDTLLANALFADGAAAVIVGNKPHANETPLFSIIGNHSLSLDNTLDKMSWEVGDQGFFMHLSSYVPPLIKRHVQSLVTPLLKDKASIEECDWPIHPGGKSILHAIERALNLKEHQTKASWEVLRNYGNMSSATFLFVLENLFQQKSTNQWAVGIGFGPGLSMEGILLQKAGSSNE